MERKNGKMNIIYVTLSLISMAMVIASKFLDTWWQSLLMCFAINILTSIFIIVFLDKAIEKQTNKTRENEEKKLERQSIIKAHKLIEVLLPRYILVFNQLTSPVGIVSEEPSGRRFNKKFEMKDLAGMFFPDFTIYGKITNSKLQTFDLMDKKIINAFESMLTKCSFKHYMPICDCINEIIKVSLQPNAIETLNYFSSNEDSSSILKQMMIEYNGNPVEDWKNNKYSGNLFIHPLSLYIYLHSMNQAIEKYLEQINVLIKEEYNEV